MPGVEELLVFDYAPKLKVVGTYHRLSERDMQILEELISQSDFVAIERPPDEKDSSYDYSISIQIRGKTKMRKLSIRMVGNPFNPFDITYFYMFNLLNNHHIDIVNMARGRKIVTSESEFDFCYRKATEMTKDVYNVDIPRTVLIRRLLRLPLKVRLTHLWAMYWGRKWPQEVDEILVKQREYGMLEGITQQEGPIERLSRNGVLVTGYSHAKNYQTSIIKLKS